MIGARVLGPVCLGQFTFMISRKIWGKSGFTLIETVLAVGVFAMVAVSGGLLLFSTLRGAKKAAAVIIVRSQGANAIGTMTQLLRYAVEVTSCSGSQLAFTAIDGSKGVFRCQNVNGDTYLASGSGRLTSPAVQILDCNTVFTCIPDAPATKNVSINFSLKRANAFSTDQFSQINFDSQIGLRNR